jgi:lysylphosphatidylglycerol synthetase-like protein (DUF2156 family)
MSLSEVPTIDRLFQRLSAALQIEWDRKKSLEQRGITVITTSGSLVTLVFASTTLVSKGKEFALLINHENELIITGLWFFVGAAALALFVNLPMFYRGIRGSRFLEILGDPFGNGEERLLKEEVDVLRAARRWNRRKSYALALAIFAEVVAVMFIVISVAYIVAHSQPSG